MKKSIIVVIDDDKENLEILKYVLSEKGYEVRGSNSPALLDELASIQPDLVILDIWLGESNGAAICGGIKELEETRHIPVVLISAIHNLEELAEKVHADSFIKKPYDLETLEQIVSKFVTPPPAIPTMTVVR
jgi:two-component system phosphate regulon response regulator PhoB